MSSVLKPKMPKMQTPTPMAVAPVSVREDAGDAKKKMRRPTGRQNSLLAGVANALKSRLGE